MDPLTHFAAPAALVLAVGGRREAAVLAGFGGLLPDVEKGVQAFYELVGSDFLLFKHGGTHSVLGAMLIAGSASLFLAERRWRGFWLVLVGTFTHLALDVISNSSGIAPLLPYSPWRLAIRGFPEMPLRAIALLAAIVLFARRPRRATSIAAT
jgi:LexA-binding, inner membrane-associated putative hydrolase